ncbi:MAG: hypothetical protein ABI858_06660 [Pseudoxanthomonas sp.]
MLFSRFFRAQPDPEINEETTLSEMKALTNRLSGVAFREFASPHRSQSGGGVRLYRKAHGTMSRIGIIPLAGVKVP